jgi:L-2,4-diaminobutyrate decarboxylase
MSHTHIPSGFDPENFRKEGHQVVDLLADYLNKALKGTKMPILPWNDPDTLADDFSFTSGGGEEEPFTDFIQRITDNSIHIHHPSYIGHQVTSPLPQTALVHLCTSLLNNGAAVYEMGPVNMAMERNVIKKFGELIGFNPGFDGIFTHGGTAGNLTAMLAARQSKTDYNIWEDGIKEDGRPAFLVSEQSHYSVARNARIMGLGERSVIKVPSDDKFRMRTDLLEKLIDDASAHGLKVIGVCANSCSTATGSYDNLNEIADFCEKHDLWLHVDGAHGLGVLFSDKYRHLADGLERADSIVIDFHKMFLVPALNTLVMFKNAERSYETFAQKASYLFHGQQKNQWFNSAVRTIECTKSALGIIAYSAIKYYGNSYMTYIDSRYDLTAWFASTLNGEPQFETATEPQSNIICFRFAPDGLNNEVLNKINAAIRDELIKDGSFYIVQTELGKILWLRTTIINPATTKDELHALIRLVRKKGTALLNS